MELAIDVTPAEAYDVVADVRAFATLSPECFAVWRFGRSRFIGWNRRAAINERGMRVRG